MVSYSCFVLFSILDIVVLILLPYIELGFLGIGTMGTSEKTETMSYIIFAIFLMIISAAVLYGIPMLLTLVQLYLKRELFKIQLFWLFISFVLPNILVITVILLRT